MASSALNFRLDPTITEEQIANLVHSFYAHVRQDELIGPVFNEAIGARWPEHFEKLTAFWSSILLASGRYKGNPMTTHVKLTRLDQEHFQRWLELWRETTTQLFGPETSKLLAAKAEFMAERLLAHIDQHHASV